MTRVMRTPAPSLVGWPRTLRATSRTLSVGLVLGVAMGDSLINAKVVRPPLVPSAAAAI